MKRGNTTGVAELRKLVIKMRMDMPDSPGLLLAFRQQRSLINFK